MNRPVEQVRNRLPQRARELAGNAARRLRDAFPGRGTLKVEAPFTGEAIGEIPIAIAEDVAAAIARARRAQAEWAARPLLQRAAALLRFHDLVLNHRDEILDLMQIETGKARRDAVEEIVDIAITARYYAYHGPRLLRPRRRRGLIPLLTRVTELRHPIGVVGIIAPWNYPLTLAVGDALPALLAGNAIVLKPAEATSLTASFAVDLLMRSGLPAGLVEIVSGRGELTGAALVEAADAICFSGSTAVGRQIAARAGARLVHASLELGGKNPMIVLADADFERTIDGAVRAAFTNAGQLCIAIERLYVEAALYDRFLDAFAARTRALKIAADFSYDTEIGSLIGAEQLAKVVAHVDDARAKGARVVVGGRARADLGPYFYEPTILTGVKPGMLACNEETFGPVVAVASFQNVEEAIRLANASEYGLSASIWSRDSARAHAIAARLNTGTVNINEAYSAAWSAVDAPMGGMKASGLGRRHGREGLYRFTESQTVAEQRLLPLTALPGQPFAQFVRMMTAALRLIRRIPGLR